MGRNFVLSRLVVATLILASASGSTAAEGPPAALSLPQTPGPWMKFENLPPVRGADGRQHQASCSGFPGTDPRFSFWAKRGSVNNLVVFFDGGVHAGTTSPARIRPPKRRRPCWSSTCRKSLLRMIHRLRTTAWPMSPTRRIRSATGAWSSSPTAPATSTWGRRRASTRCRQSGVASAFDIPDRASRLRQFHRRPRLDTQQFCWPRENLRGWLERWWLRRGWQLPLDCGELPGREDACSFRCRPGCFDTGV